MEKCFGIAKDGMNECSSNKSAHSCAGQPTSSNDPMDFVEVPKGTCNKIAAEIQKPQEIPAAFYYYFTEKITSI